MKQVAFLFTLASTLSASFPDFLVLGAQKGGTTALYRYLQEHPLIEMPVIKEQDFFTHNYAEGEAHYFSQFPEKDGNGYPFSGDISPDYLRIPQAPARARQLLPNAKLIVLLRNPTDRAFSRYVTWVDKGYTSESFEALVDEEITFIQNGRKGERPQFGFIRIGFYADQLKQWLKYYPKEQLLIILSEDFYQNTQECMDRIYDHIGLPRHKYESFPVVNKSPLPLKLNPETRAKVDEFYRPYNDQVQKLFDDLKLNITHNWNNL